MRYYLNCYYLNWRRTMTNNVTIIEETVRKYIAGAFLPDEGSKDLRCDEDLFAILDSLQILRMLIELEQNYSIKVSNSELTAENLGTVERLAAFIAKKREDRA